MGHGTSVIPWPIKIAIIGVLAWIAWRLSRPATYGLGMVGHAAGFAWSFVAGRARHTLQQPAQHTERGPVAATTSPTRTPSQQVVFMPGITDRPLAPAAAVPPTPGAAAALPGGPSRPRSEGLDEAIQETIERSPESEKDSWKRLYADFPRGRNHTYLEKAQWAAEAYEREGLEAHHRNRLRGQWFHHALAPEYRSVEVSVFHTKPNGEAAARFRVDGIDDAGIASIKNVQFADVTLKTSKGYINETWKYQPNRPGIVIANTKGNRDKVERGELDDDEIGDVLRGDVFLDVPPQKKPIPQEIIDYALEKGVMIREREPHPDAGVIDD